MIRVEAEEERVKERRDRAVKEKKRSNRLIISIIEVLGLLKDAFSLCLCFLI